MDLTEKEFVDYYINEMNNAPEQGTDEYVDFLKKIYDHLIVENKCTRPDDLCVSLVCKYIANYQIKFEKENGYQMKAEDIFDIDLPWWLHDDAYKI